MTEYGDFIDFEIERGHIKPLIRMQPRPAPEGVGFVDQISFTFNDDLHSNRAVREFVQEQGGGLPNLDEELVLRRQVGAIVRFVFGLDVGDTRAAGLNFYRTTVSLQDGAGMLSIGGQAGTILVQITGHGLACALAGWQVRLLQVSEILTRFVITRLDVAFDDHEGKHYSVDAAVADYDAGAFGAGGRPPSFEQRGNWRKIDGKGRTVYVGRRENGKLLRVYEKGKQLGDLESDWLRVELELHNKDRVIPFDAVLRPGSYLAGAYVKALAWVAMGEPHERIVTAQMATRITYEALLGHLRRSYGGLIKVILEAEPEALDCLAVVGQGRPVPKRLDLALSALVRA